MNATLWYLNRLIEQAHSSIDLAARQVERARCVEDVARALRSVHVPSLVRHDGSVRTAQARLERSSLIKADALVAPLIDKLKLQAGQQEKEAARRALMVCRGALPHVAVVLERALVRAAGRG